MTEEHKIIGEIDTLVQKLKAIMSQELDAPVTDETQFAECKDMWLEAFKAGVPKSAVAPAVEKITDGRTNKMSEMEGKELIEMKEYGHFAKDEATR